MRTIESVDILRIRFKSIIILPWASAFGRKSYSLQLPVFFSLLFGSVILMAWTWDSKNIYCFHHQSMGVCYCCCCCCRYLDHLMTEHNIMKRLFALCNSIIWFFFCRWLFGFHDIDMKWIGYRYIDSDLMPIFLEATEYGHI